MPASADWARVTLALTAVVVAAYLAAGIVGRLARAALLSVVRDDGPLAGVAAIVHHPIRVIRFAVFAAAVLALALPALELAGVETSVGLTSRALTAWLFGSGFRILVISILTYAVLRIISATARGIELEMGDPTSPDKDERLKRARTLSRLVQNALTVLVVSIAGLMVLHELQVDIMPILTGAGIVGLAVGFGAHTLVKDLIAGFFLTLENQIRVGDVAVINGVGGLVEAINLRTIVLRDSDGTVHVFPNGSIDRLSNRTKDFSYAVVDVRIGYAEDPDRVFAVLRELGAGLATDPALGPILLGPVEVLGIEAFEEAGMVLRVRVKTLPLRQWDVARELRRRIVKTFDELGLVMPVRPAAALPAPAAVAAPASERPPVAR
ncbi:MAG: mechanosensitive ion channel family protein [Acidimicrobiia bacterium]|nr:mechanosensitive ion channel family protein [Acidimicrobiia bacterium]